ncbi:hypothetical protein CYY_007295 [Polysphondylium violaceum]|uniref:Uncharacterized protein n=1 Tax=Polysphondylium violaceum TaxID=133409 RepID=A0A8J4PPT8_9MYCE|nr:hypothetical protein CYY_007295 [Polysphondylium violaceum]
MKLFIPIVIVLSIICFHIQIGTTQSQQSVDPWIFQQRDLLYQNIIDATHIPSLFNADNSNNCLWGLRLQFHWQYNSGRLEATGSNINQQSWWADMNYFLSVIPYLAAMRANLVPQVIITPPSDPMIASKVCTTFETCNSTMMARWYNFFETIVAHQNGSSSTTDSELLEIMWMAHTESIHVALEKFDRELKLFSEKESKFGFGWANFVEVISIVNFNTNFTQVTTLSADLPNRMLKFTDFPPFITNMTKDMNNIVLAIHSIADLAKTPLWNPFLDTLRAICKKPACQTLIDNKIQEFVSHPIPTILDILFNIMSSCSK